MGSAYEPSLNYTKEWSLVVLMGAHKRGSQRSGLGAAKLMKVFAKLCSLGNRQSWETNASLSRPAVFKPSQEAITVQEPKPQRELMGKPCPKLAYCLSMSLAQFAHGNGPLASAMFSLRMSRCRLPSGSRDKRRMKPSRIDLYGLN